jgi:hypothetical protein
LWDPAGNVGFSERSRNRDGEGFPDLDRFSRHHPDALPVDGVEGIVELPWSIATSGDLRFPGDYAGQTRQQNIVVAWTRQLGGLLAAHGDRGAQNTLSAVYQRMADPRLLFHPALLVAAARAKPRDLGKPNPRPRELPTSEPIENTTETSDLAPGAPPAETTGGV